MRTKIASIIAAGWMMATAGVAVADHHEGGGHWTLMGKEGHQGSQYRLSLTHNDNNINVGKDDDATATSSIALGALNVQMDGRLNKSVTFDTNLHLLTDLVKDGKATFIHWAYLDWAMSDMITIRGGRERINAGGFDNDANGMYFDMLGSAYRNLSGFGLWSLDQTGGGTADLVEVMIKAGGMVSLQFINDTMGSNNKGMSQPAMILEYKGQFGPVMPLVQVGSYDLNDDMFFTLGVKFKAAGLMGYLDFVTDNQNKVGADGKDATDTATAINLRLDYNLGSYTPFFKIATLDVKQDGTDAKSNGTIPSDEGYAFGDNAQHFALGVICNAGMGGHYSPFFVLKNYSGKFTDASDGNKEVTKANMQIEVGVMGEF